MVSSEWAELLGMTDRILVMRAGAIVAEISDPKRATQSELLHLAMHSTPKAMPGEPGPGARGARDTRDAP